MSMEEEPSIFDYDDPEAEEASMRRGEADADAGRLVSHDAVKAWLLSWGTANELPKPKSGA